MQHCLTMAKAKYKKKGKGCCPVSQPASSCWNWLGVQQTPMINNPKLFLFEVVNEVLGS